MPTELRTTSSAMLLTETPVATPTVSLTAEQVLRMEMVRETARATVWSCGASGLAYWRDRWRTAQLMHKMAQALQDPHADARYRLMEHLVSQFHQARAEASERESAAPVAAQQPQAPSQQPVSSTSVASLAASDMASDDALLDVDDATDLSAAALVAPAINGSGALAAMSTSSSSSSASQHENKERQALILRANVLSFRRLSRNLPLTPELRSVVTKTIEEAEEWDGLSELVSASGEPLSLPVPTVCPRASEQAGRTVHPSLSCHGTDTHLHSLPAAGPRSSRRIVRSESTAALLTAPRHSNVHTQAHTRRRHHNSFVAHDQGADGRMYA